MNDHLDEKAQKVLSLIETYIMKSMEKPEIVHTCTHAIQRSNGGRWKQRSYRFYSNTMLVEGIREAICVDTQFIYEYCSLHIFENYFAIQNP